MPRTSISVIACLILSGVAVAACGSDPSSPRAPSPSSAADSSQDAAAPADPGVVLALDDFTALAALTLGVTPDMTFDAFGYVTSAAILADQGAPTEPYGAELDLEAVAAERPDVIVGVSIPSTVSVEDQLGQIAPTTVVEYTDPWREQLRTVATALGREDRAEQLIAAVTEQADEVAADLDAAGLSGSTVSLLGDSGGMFSPPSGTPVGSVLTDVGLARPAAQDVELAADAPFVMLSEETLPDHDADHIYLLSGGAYATEGFTGSPLWGTLGAVQRGDVSQVDAEVWFSSSAFAISWIIDDVRRTLLDGEPAKTGDQAAEVFADYVEEN